MKIGKEVEGRFRGIPTLFMNASEFLNPKKADKAERYFHMCRQVYISDLRNVIRLNRDLRLKKWAKDMIVTVEVSHLPIVPPDDVNIILQLAVDPAFRHLRLDDQIKIESEKLRVYTVTVRQMVESYPSEYEDDKVIE